MVLARKLAIAVPGRLRVWCDGSLFLDETNQGPWAHSHPFEPWECNLPAQPFTLLIEADYNRIDCEVFAALSDGEPAPVTVGEVAEAWRHDPSSLSQMASRSSEPRQWSAPRHNQITAGYCAGMLEPDEATSVLRQCLREEYHVPWLKRTTRLICTATNDRELIATRAVLCNTSHSLSCFCRALSTHAMQNQARDLCQKLFAAMTDAGSSTLWEEFAPRSSLCHAWGGFCVEHLLAHKESSQNQ
jgi:hypothetical protein